MRFPIPLSIAALAGLITFVLAGAAFARETVRPARPVAIPALRRSRRALPDADLDVRAGRPRPPHAHLVHVPPQRRSGVPAVDDRHLDAPCVRRPGTWLCARVHRRLAVAIPRPPRLHSALSRRVAYTPAADARPAAHLSRVGHAGASRAPAGKTGAATLELWQRRLAAATLAGAAVRASPAPARAQLARSSASTTTRAPGTRTPATATTAGSRWTGGSRASTAAISSPVGARPTTGRRGRSSRRRSGRTGRDGASTRGRTRPAPAA